MRWVKSSQSYANGNCVEVAALHGVVLARDSQDPRGPVLMLTAGQWRAFLASVRCQPVTRQDLAVTGRV